MGCASSNTNHVAPLSPTSPTTKRPADDLNSLSDQPQKYDNHFPRHRIYITDDEDSIESPGVGGNEAVCAAAHRRTILVTKIVDKWKDFRYGEAEVEDDPVPSSLSRRVLAWLDGVAVVADGCDGKNGDVDVLSFSQDQPVPIDACTEIGSATSTLCLSPSQAKGLNPIPPTRLISEEGLARFNAFMKNMASKTMTSTTAAVVGIANSEVTAQVNKPFVANGEGDGECFGGGFNNSVHDSAEVNEVVVSCN
eukprot:PhM_4_TR18605/c1_g1_i3/m.30943